MDPKHSQIYHELFFPFESAHWIATCLHICVVMTINFFRIIRIDDRCFWIEVKFVIAEKVFCEHAGEHGRFCITIFFKKIFFRLRNLHFQIPIFNYFINYYLPLKCSHFSLSFFNISAWDSFQQRLPDSDRIEFTWAFFIIFIHFPSQSFLIHLFSFHATAHK